MVSLRSKLCQLLVAIIACLMIISTNGQFPSGLSTMQPSAEATPSFQPTQSPTFLTVTEQPTAVATTLQPTWIPQPGVKHATNQPTMKATTNQPTNKNEFLVQTGQPTAAYTYPGQTYQPTAAYTYAAGVPTSETSGSSPVSAPSGLTGNVGTPPRRTNRPTKAPVRPPTRSPNFQPPPTRTPTRRPVGPSRRPTVRPSQRPTMRPTTRRPTTTGRPTTTRRPTTTSRPTLFPPTPRPTAVPTMEPTNRGQVAVASVQVTIPVSGVPLTTLRSNKFQNYVGWCFAKILEEKLPAGNYRSMDVNVTQIVTLTPAIPATPKALAVPATYGVRLVITKANANPANIIAVLTNPDLLSRRRLSELDDLLGKKYPGSSVGLPAVLDISTPVNPATTTGPLSSGGIAGIVIAGCVVIVLIVLLSIYIPKYREQIYLLHLANQQELQLTSLGSSSMQPTYEVRV